MYKQLTLAQRYTISTLRQNGFSLQAIADELNRLREEEAALKGEAAPTKKIAASTISRELKRNRNKRGGYPDEVAQAVIRLLRPYKKHVLTITTDNGIEFRNHRDIAKALGCTVYFADPYCSGQKGAVENANKILREFFPKGTNFMLVTQEELNKVQYQINDRPRKKLGFSTPKIEFFKRIG